MANYSGKEKASLNNIKEFFKYLHGGSARDLRKALGLGDTLGALPIANGGTGSTSAESAIVNLGIDKFLADYIERNSGISASMSSSSEMTTKHSDYFKKVDSRSFKILKAGTYTFTGMLTSSFSGGGGYDGGLKSVGTVKCGSQTVASASDDQHGRPCPSGGFNQNFNVNVSANAGDVVSVSVSTSRYDDRGGGAYIKISSSWSVNALKVIA